MDISVIILTANEEVHIARCLERLAPLEPQQVYVIDCLSKDKTAEIAKKMGATVVAHEWPGNQAEQFNWALDNCKIKSKWVLRIDADEYLSNKLIEEIKEKVENLPQNVTAVGFPRLATWQGKLLKHGTGAVMITRLFRFGKARSNDRKMDEQIVPFEGEIVVFEHLFFDDNLNGFDWWQAKHRNYAEREAQSMIEEKYGDVKPNSKKAAYLKMPPYVRCVIYWAYRYFGRLGFLDGVAGWRWNFWQGLWYRWIVDRRYCELRKERIARQR